MADIQCVFESMTDKGSIYISNIQAAQNLTVLQERGIKAIVSMAKRGFVQHNREDIPHYLYIPAEDHQDYEIYKHFNKTYEFIDNARKETNVLVHCMVGVSRSVTIVMAYLLKKYKVSLSEVITIIQRKRKKINPNKGFIEQLKKYAQVEGLKCDFQGVSVPTIRQRSNSAKKRRYSLESAIKENQIQVMPNVCIQTSSLNQKGENTRGKTTLKTLNSFQKELSKIEAISEKKQAKDAQRSKLEESKDQRPPQNKITSLQKRQVSIEQKINKVREKMKKQQAYLSRPRSSSLAKQGQQQKCVENQQQNNKKEENNHEGQISKKLQDYLKIYRKSNKITELISVERKQNSNSQNKVNPKPQIQSFNSCELKEEAIYSKAKIMKPRITYGRRDH